MVHRIVCSNCGTELETFYTKCPHCDAPDAFIGYYDVAGSYHEAGCGNMPDGTECGECSIGDCNICRVWTEHLRRHQNYIHWKCEECGNELEIWLDRVEESRPAEGDSFPYERRHLIWHCTECGCDYENYWETQWGDTGESMIQRKYWG